MRISLIPIGQIQPEQLTIIKAGDVLTINGDATDFSVIPDGASLPADAIDCKWLSGTIERIGGELHLSVLLPHGVEPDQCMSFPAPIENVPDGPVDLPFATRVEITEQPAPGGKIFTIKTTRWHEPVSIDTQYVPEQESSTNGEN